MNMKRKLICFNVNLYNDQNTIMPASQKHGFFWENSIRNLVFGLTEEVNNTDIHDVPFTKNKFNPNENISIKVTGGASIDCADIMRFFSYNHDDYLHTIVCVKYKQQGSLKVVNNIYEFNYSKEMRDYLFGSVTLQELENYVKLVKSIPKGKVSKDLRDKYVFDKKRLQKENNMKIKISPKVDSKSQRRVQCSIPKFEQTLAQFIVYQSPENSPSLLRGVKIPEQYSSGNRIRNKTKQPEVDNS